MITKLFNKKIFLLSLFVLICGFGFSNKVFAAYSYSRTVTIDHTKIPNSDQTSFPVLVCGNGSTPCNTTIAGLNESGAGAHVIDPNGYDIVFSTASDCSSGLLKWEMEKYVPSTGEFYAWVTNVSTALSHTTNTVIYMCYGNGAISTFQGGASTWDSSYKGVWHLGDITNITDSTGNNNLTNHSLSNVAGQIDGSAQNGASAYADHVDSATLNPSTGITISAWVKRTRIGTREFIVTKGNGINSAGGAYWLEIGSNNNLKLELSNGTSDIIADSGLAITDTNWHFVWGKWGSSGAQMTMAVDNTKAYSTWAGGGPINNDTNNFTVFALTPSSLQFVGSEDELRLSNTERSEDWMTTEYNNQTSPTTFYALGSETTLGSGSDITSPTPGGSGTITTASVTDHSLTLNWTKGIDNVSTQGALQYIVYKSTSNNIDTVTNIEANGTALNSYTTDIATLNVGSLSPSTTYYFNVIVKDEAGNKAAYTNKSQATIADAVSPTVDIFTIPSTATALTVNITSFTAHDDVAVTGYKLTESLTPTPLAGDSGWTGSAPGTYTFSIPGAKTLYAWTKDAGGNVSTSLNAPITITLPPPQNIYIAQTSAGSADGTSCANAYAYTFFNTSGNWSNPKVTGKIGPSDTVHLCGTFTGTSGQKFLTAQGSGLNGYPITIKFETNAVMQAPYFSSTGTIVLDGQSYIVIDGGTNGVMQNTLNGSPGATCTGGPCSTIQNSVAISALPCPNCEVKNLTFSNLYVHTQCEASSGCDTAIDQTWINAIRFQGSNFLIHDNTIHDVGWALDQNYTADSGVQIYNNNIYNFDHGITCAGGSYTLQSMSIYNNHFHDMQAWDTGTANAYHHDGIHCFNSANNGKIQNIYIYNNLFDGNQGNNVTAWIFLEGGPLHSLNSNSTPWTDSTGTAYIFNNIAIGTADITIGQFSIANGNGHQIFNNAIIAPNLGNSGSCLSLYTTTNISIENNVMQGCDTAISADTGSSYTTINYNAYANLAGGNPYWTFGSINSGNNTPPYTGNFTTWKSLCNCDSNSMFQPWPNPWANFSNSSGVPSTGFVGIGAGVNLTSLSITGLNLDKNGVARPSGSTAWDMGAYSYIPTYTIGGTISGLSGTVTLQNNSGDNYATSTNGTFVFATPLNNSASYAVTVSTQPSGQTCAVGSGSGTVSSANVTSVTVTCVNTTKAISTFNFAGLTPTVTGTVDNTAHTVALTVPFATDVTALIPTITHTGASISPLSGIAGNFTTPQTYRVTAADSSHQDYVVTVTISPNTAKAITGFTISGQTGNTTIDETAHTIALTVTYGTSLTSLTPTIIITGSSVSPVSDLAQNFSSPVTYTVTAANASTQNYVVTVSVGAAPVVTGGGPLVGGNGAPVGLMGGHRQDISNLISVTPTTTPTVTKTIPTPTLPKYNFTRNLSLHATGKDVKALQQYLNTHGFVISKTGAGSLGKETTLFGILTYKSLVKLQKSLGWSGTGFFGPMTREYINNQ